MDQFDEIVVVERVLSQLERGCIFAGRLDDGSPIRVKFAGTNTQPLPGDAFHVKGLTSQHRDRFGKTVVQIDSKQMLRQVTPGTLIGPWLERLVDVNYPDRSATTILAGGSGE